MCDYFDGLVQDCSNPIANALEFLQSCTKPSIYTSFWLKDTLSTALVDAVQMWDVNISLPLDHIFSWWRHQIETFSAFSALCAGNSPVSGEFHAQRPVTRSFDLFFDLHLNKRLKKQSWCWWFETLSSPLCRHCNVWESQPRGEVM